MKRGNEICSIISILFSQNNDLMSANEEEEEEDEDEMTEDEIDNNKCPFGFDFLEK